MTKNLCLSAISLALSLGAISVNAATNGLVDFDYTVGQYTSTQANVITQTFATTAAPGGYVGGGYFSTTTSEYAIPKGSDSNYYSVGISGGQTGPGIVTLAGPSNYFGFLWGSPDSYNHISFYSGDTLLASFDGSAVLQPPTGDQNYSAYFNVYANSPLNITSVVFQSEGGNAFETDNHSVSAVPEPETYGMMLAGLGLMGFVARRRKV
jgi:hypothetical protein